MDTKKWKKPNGNEIAVNNDKATDDYCESLGWERVSDIQSGDEAKPDGSTKNKKNGKNKRG